MVNVNGKYESLFFLLVSLKDIWLFKVKTVLGFITYEDVRCITTTA